MKLCITCKIKEVYAPRYSYCRECQSILVKKWRKDNIEYVKEKAKIKYINKSTPESRRRNKYLTRYGITLEEFKKMENEQMGLCAICQRPPVRHKKVLCVDHCHETEKVRGLLCDDCNNLLGRAKDNPMILISAVVYLLDSETAK
mgnify:CR=1 FL=1